MRSWKVTEVFSNEYSPRGKPHFNTYRTLRMQHEGKNKERHKIKKIRTKRPPMNRLNQDVTPKYIQPNRIEISGTVLTSLWSYYATLYRRLVDIELFVVWRRVCLRLSSIPSIGFPQRIAMSLSEYVLGVSSRMFALEWVLFGEDRTDRLTETWTDMMTMTTTMTMMRRRDTIASQI